MTMVRRGPLFDCTSALTFHPVAAASSPMTYSETHHTGKERRSSTDDDDEGQDLGESGFCKEVPQDQSLTRARLARS